VKYRGGFYFKHNLKFDSEFQTIPVLI